MKGKRKSFLEYLLLGAIVAGIAVDITAITTMWDLCNPLAVVMICSAISGIVSDQKIDIKRYLCTLPAEGYVVYILWAENTWLALAYAATAFFLLLIRCVEG